MAQNFHQIAFTDAVKALQTEHGSRNSYERMEKFNVVNGLSENEMGFIANRDSFYLASIGENHFPYIQHRGGPKGFCKSWTNTAVGLSISRAINNTLPLGIWQPIPMLP